MEVDNDNRPPAPENPINTSRTSSGDSINPALTSAAIFDQVPPLGSVPTSPASSAASGPIELEAVVSCTSDGLVVCLRRARPMIPGYSTSPQSPGIFAAPWAPEPVFMPPLPVPGYLGQQTPGGPLQTDFLNCIREVGAFAWGLVGINGNFADHARGTPSGDAQPSEAHVFNPPMHRQQTQDSGNASASSSDYNNPSFDPENRSPFGGAGLAGH